MASLPFLLLMIWIAMSCSKPGTSISSIKDNEVNNALPPITSYVTPEQFGALGNGLKDDTEALQNAIASGKPVILNAKTYIISTALILKKRNSNQRRRKIFHN